MRACMSIWPSPLPSMSPVACKSEAAAKKAAAQKQCFLVDYQMPTDPHVLECAKRFREGALGNLGVVKSFYYGGLFGDPPLTENIESRLRHLVWVNDVAIGGSLPRQRLYPPHPGHDVDARQDTGRRGWHLAHGTRQRPW